MGPRQHALVEGERAQSLVPSNSSSVVATNFMLWVDGVLDAERAARLENDPAVTAVIQHQDYVLVYFFKQPRRQHYRFLDPHRFVVQLNEICPELEINFNPTPGELEKLREFIKAQRVLRITFNGH